MQKSLLSKLQKKYFDRKLPLVVHWELTYGCNLKCIHCYTDNEDKRKYLSLLQIEDIARQLKDMGTIHVVLSGGEPFLRDDIMDIIEILRRDFFVVVLTNATMIDSEKAKKLKELNVAQVEISLYALDKHIHDTITGVTGSHTKTMEGIHHLNEEGVRVTIKCSIMKQNIAEYPKIVDFARSLGLRLYVSPLINPRLDGCQTPYEYYVKDKGIDLYISQWVKNNRKKLESVEKKPLILKEDSFICNAGHVLCSITPDGYLKACPIIPVKLGNLLDKNFRELWQKKPTKFLKSIRDAKITNISECRTCKWVSQCSPCPGVNWLESGDAFVAANGYCSIKKRIMETMTM